jgi:ATP-binding cassette, subfamily B, bacterial MsbA
MAKERGASLDLKSYARLWREWIVRYRMLVGAVFVLMVVEAVASASYAKVMQLVIEAYETNEFSVIWWGPLLVLGLTFAKGGSEYMRVTRTNVLLTGLEADLQKHMFERLVGTDLARLQTEAPAGLATRFSSDIGLIAAAVKSLIGGISGVLVIVVTFGVMLSIDWPLTIALLLVFTLAYTPITVIGRKLKRLSSETQGKIAGMTAEVTEGLSGIRMARTYQLEEPLTDHAGHVFDTLRALKQKQNRWSARVSPLLEMLVGMAIALLLVVVGWRMAQGTMTLADFTGLLTGLGVASGPARKLGGLYAQAQQGQAALDRVFLLFDVENTITDGPNRIGRVHGHIQFDGVGFAYPNGFVALEDVTLEVPAGTKAAFVGRSGAGKSTVFNLLPRLYDPTAGRILIDGADIRQATLASLRENIAVVSQDSILLTGTVADNIGFGRRNATREAIEAAARAAQADGFIRALPMGYDTPVIPTAGQFSGGERQRLSIARAILRDAPILLLDEPTSALDAESEAAIRAALARLALGRTTLIIAHRLTTVLDSDMIVVMDRGRVVETGSHTELLALGGLYADLYALQFAAA